nr:MAG TPA: hypothetical protein [Bacteriophage sp.]
MCYNINIKQDSLGRRVEESLIFFLLLLFILCL